MSPSETEFTRIAAIEEIAKRHNLPGYFTSHHVEAGSTLETVRGDALERIGALASSGVVHLGRMPADLQLTQRERKQYSLRRAILSQLANTPDTELRAAAQKIGNASFEMECSQEIAMRAGSTRSRPSSPRGMFIPLDVFTAPDADHGHPPSMLGGMSREFDLQQRTLLASSGTGQNLVPTNLLGDKYIAPNYNVPQVVNAGATVLSGLKGNVLIPKMTAGKSGTWVTPENTSVAAADATFAQLSMTPKDLGCVTDMSRRLLLQSSPAVDGLMRDDIKVAIWNGIDTAALVGTGAGGQPIGILNTAGVPVISSGTNGGPLTWTNVTYLLQRLGEGNRLGMGPTSFISTAQLLLHAMRTQKIPGSIVPTFIAEYAENRGLGRMNDGVGGTMVGLPLLVSQNVPSNLVKGTSGAICSALFAGTWSDLIIGEWGQMDLIADPYTFSNTGALRLTCFISVDIQVRYPQAFSMMTDLITT